MHRTHQAGSPRSRRALTPRTRTARRGCATSSEGPELTGCPWLAYSRGDARCHPTLPYWCATGSGSNRSEMSGTSEAVCAGHPLVRQIACFSLALTDVYVSNA
jgi:hypothetical protein